MRKKILAFVFAAAVLMAMAVPLFSGGGTALAHQGHKSCKGYGQILKAADKDLVSAFRSANVMGPVNATQHSLASRCVQS